MQVVHQYQVIRDYTEEKLWHDLTSCCDIVVTPGVLRSPGLSTVCLADVLQIEQMHDGDKYSNPVKTLF